MSTHAEKTKRVATGVATVAQQRNWQAIGERSHQPKAIAQLKLQAVVNNGLRAQQALVMQRAINGNRQKTVVLTGPVPRQAAQLVGRGVLQKQEDDLIVDVLSWNTVPASSLSLELQEGLAHARGSADAKPNPLPAWVRATVESATGYEAEIVAERARLTAINKQQYDAKPAISSNNPDKEDWVTKQVDKAMAKFVNGLNLSVQSTIDLGFKWNEDYANRDGKLPGIKGAGGYKEYYAPPAPGAIGTWGKNRILHKINAIGGHDDSWWATSDHYGFFHKVV